MAATATTDFKGGAATSSYYMFQPNWGTAGGGPNGYTTPNQAPQGGVNPTDLHALTTDVLGFQSSAQEYTAAAQGSRLSAAGSAAEAAAYGSAAAIAEQNQRTELTAEQVRQFQITRDLTMAYGGVSASVAGAGFAQGGSAADIMRSSMRQGALTAQVSALGSQETQLGYLQQEQAALGEQSAANVRVTAAQTLAETQDKAAAAAMANQTSLTQAMTQLLGNDPYASKLITDITAGNAGGALADSLLYNPQGATKPLNPVAPTPPGGGTSTTNPGIYSDYGKLWT